MRELRRIRDYTQIIKNVHFTLCINHIFLCKKNIKRQIIKLNKFFSNFYKNKNQI